jgi:hypothetical protein
VFQARLKFQASCGISPSGFRNFPCQFENFWKLSNYKVDCRIFVAMFLPRIFPFFPSFQFNDNTCFKEILKNQSFTVDKLMLVNVEQSLLTWLLVIYGIARIQSKFPAMGPNLQPRLTGVPTCLQT